MLKEFKEFAAKGNMIDMAVGIVIGAAFATVISSLVDDIIMPVISSVTGSPDFSNLFVILREPVGEEVNMASLESVREAGGVALAYGLFINAIIAFLLVALALFFVVKGMNNMKRKQKEKPAAAPPPPAEVVLLEEIRDLLKKK